MGGSFTYLPPDERANFAAIEALLAGLPDGKQRNDYYRLTVALRPSTVHIELSTHTRFTPLPILATYRGDKSRYTFTTYLNL